MEPWQRERHPHRVDQVADPRGHVALHVLVGVPNDALELGGENERGDHFLAVRRLSVVWGCGAGAIGSTLRRRRARAPVLGGGTPGGAASSSFSAAQPRRREAGEAESEGFEDHGQLLQPVLPIVALTDVNFHPGNTGWPGRLTLGSSRVPPQLAGVWNTVPGVGAEQDVVLVEDDRCAPGDLRHQGER